MVVGNEEATDIAMKRFRREVMTAGVIPEVRNCRPVHAMVMMHGGSMLAVHVLLELSPVTSSIGWEQT